MGKVNGFSLLKSLVECMILSGPFLVSRTGDEGWTWCTVKVLNNTLIRYHKGCWFIWTAGRWSWKSKSAKECVTTHLPNGLAPKMDGAQAGDWYPTTVSNISVCRRAWWFVTQPLVQTWVKQLLVQILVVVAIIQMKTLKTEVEKGFMWTVLGHGLAGHKR